MKFHHYTSKPFKLDKNFSYDKWSRRDDKPIGLWFTPDTDDNWLSWCKAKEFGLEKLAYRHEIKFDLQKILFLKSSFEIDHFTFNYVRKETGFLSRQIVDWPKLATQYSGIIISPYQWSRRLSGHCFWYYNWDCASGCMWDLGIISDWGEAEKVEKEAKSC
jgi:hypothetical protein